MMGFLQRSKSAGVANQNIQNKDTKVAKPLDSSTGGEGKRSASSERPKTAEQPTSFSRPRTANASLGQPAEFVPPSFRIDFKAGDEIFSFPTPTPRPLSSRSTGEHPVPSFSGEPELPSIGLAIGSPDQVRPPCGRSFTVDDISNRMPPHPPPTRPPPAIPEHPDLEVSLTAVKRRKSTWKAFGGLFGRRNATTTSEEPLYKLHLVKPNIDKPAVLVRDEVFQELAKLPASQMASVGLHQRSPSLTRGQARFEARAEADRASFMSYGQPKMLRSPSVIQREGLSPMFREIQGIPEETTWTDDLRKDSPLSMMSITPPKTKPNVNTVAIHGTPTLVLDLPGPKFERYSVMFEKVLNESRPSLLERRQSKLNRNSSIKKLELPVARDERRETPTLGVYNVPQRSITSPGLAKSLSMRLGKKVLSPVSEVFSALNRPRPLRRSKTAPKLIASPMMSSFSNPKIAVSSISPSSTAPGQGSLPATPMTIATISECGSVEIITTDMPFDELEKAEPSWEMITSQPIEGRDHYLQVRSPAGLEKQIVQLSVAKQISVSKAMAQMQDSLDCRKSLRPKVVELNKTRRSTLVVIESIEE